MGSRIPYPVLGLAVENDWNLLKSWCRYLGLSWKDLATQADISLLDLSRLENGKNAWSQDLEKVAKAMKLDTEQLIDQ